MYAVIVKVYDVIAKVHDVIAKVYDVIAKVYDVIALDKWCHCSGQRLLCVFRVNISTVFQRLLQQGKALQPR